MSVLDVLDATRLCSRWSSDDPSVWARPTELRPVAPPAPVAPAAPHSWRRTVLNPQAVLLTGLVGAGLVLDAGQRILVAALHP